MRSIIWDCNICHLSATMIETQSSSIIKISSWAYTGCIGIALRTSNGDLWVRRQKKALITVSLIWKLQVNCEMGVTKKEFESRINLRTHPWFCLEGYIWLKLSDNILWARRFWVVQAFQGFALAYLLCSPWSGFDSTAGDSESIPAECPTHKRKIVLLLRCCRTWRIPPLLLSNLMFSLA